jgi:di/tricarboxylate transporter
LAALKHLPSKLQVWVTEQQKLSFFYGIEAVTIFSVAILIISLIFIWITFRPKKTKVPIDETTLAREDLAE